MKQRRQSVLNLSAYIVVLALAVVGCARKSESKNDITNAEIITELNTRAGARAAIADGKDGTGNGVYGPSSGKRELHILVRQHVNGEDIICGWSGFPPAKAFNGGDMWSGPDTIFIIRHRHLYISGDMPAKKFDAWQDLFCGQEWVKPFNIPAAWVPR